VKIILLFLALAFGLGTISAAEARVEVLGLESYTDPGAKLSIDEIVALPASAWRPVVERLPRYGFSRARHWLRFRLSQEPKISQARIIDIPYIYNFRVNFYVSQGRSIVHRSQTGLAVPFSRREPFEIKTGSNTFRWVVPPQDPNLYYLSAEGALPLGLPFTVYAGNEYAEFHGLRQLVLGFFFGGLLFAILFNAFLAVILRSRLYAYYAAFVFFMTLLAFSHEGFSVLFLWPEFPWWAQREIHVSGGLSLLFYALFVSQFLNTKKNAPWLHRAMFFLVAVSSARVLWVFLVGDNLTVFKIGEAAVIAAGPFILLISLVCAWRGVASARIFFASSLAYNLFFAIFLLQLTNVVELGPFFDYSAHMGLCSEVVLLSLALADRIRRTNVRLQLANEALDREIKERQRAEANLEEERKLTVHAEKLRALGRMAAGIAHEINNPLAIIHGNAVLLKGMADRGNVAAPALSGIAGTIEKTTERISRIVKSMRSLSRDSKQDPFTRHSLFAILQDCQSLTQDRFRAGGVAFTISFPAADCALLCRGAEIGQVLVNLLANAYDAVEGSGGWVKVELSVREGDVEFAVCDSGPGIAAAIRERIQEPFFTTKDVGRGTGLGLSISRTIVAAHGGSLWLDEKSPHTRFVFTVPRAKP